MGDRAEMDVSKAWDGATATQYWHALADGRIQCDVCPRHCRLREGQRGLCFIRASQNGISIEEIEAHRGGVGLRQFA